MESEYQRTERERALY